MVRLFFDLVKKKYCLHNKCMGLYGNLAKSAMRPVLMLFFYDKNKHTHINVIYHVLLLISHDFLVNVNAYLYFNFPV